MRASEDFGSAENCLLLFSKTWLPPYACCGLPFWLTPLPVSCPSTTPLHYNYTLFRKKKHKQSWPGFHVEPAETLAFEQNSRLCLVKRWKSYQRREPKTSEQVINCLSTVSNRMCLWADRRFPAGWRALSAAGTDTDVFSSHSTRAASCSALAEKGVTLSTTMTAAGWSSDRTFTKWQEAEQGNLWSTCLRPVFEQVTFTSCVRRRLQVDQMYL